MVRRSDASRSAISASSAYWASTGSPASTASIASSDAATSGSIGSSWSSSRIAGLPELLHRAVQQRAGVRFADPEHPGQLGIGQAGVELQRDDLALPRRQLGQRRLERGAAQGNLDPILVVRRNRLLSRLGHQRGDPPAPAQLVQRRVAGDPEQPGPLLAAPAVERAAAPIGALEGERGYVLGGRRISQQRADVRVYIVAARAVQS